MKQQKKSRKEDFPSRLRDAMSLRGMDRAALARATQTAWTSVDRWFTGSTPRQRTMQDIASALRVSLEWLRDGVGDMDAPPCVTPKITERVDIMNRPALPAGAIQPQWVPLKSWAHAGQAASYEELPQEWQEAIPTTCRSPNAFALAIEGDSMAPQCQPGDLVIVMPEEEPRNSCLVVANLKNDGVVLRRYARRADGRIRLVAYNDDYPAEDYSPAAFHWIYPVHSTIRREWK